MTDEESRSLSVEILKQIRDEGRRTNEQLDGLTTRVDRLMVQVDERSKAVNVRFADLGQRIVESELRTATAITQLARNVDELASFLREQADLLPRVERCERDIAELKAEYAQDD